MKSKVADPAVLGLPFEQAGAVAQEYLKYLYSPEAQEIIARHFYRPRDPAVAAKYASRFPQLRLLTIADFGGWNAANARHFAAGATFDRIYARK